MVAERDRIAEALLRSASFDALLPQVARALEHDGGWGVGLAQVRSMGSGSDVRPPA